MDNFAVNNLANMENALYGYRGGASLNCPSWRNGYMAVPNYNMNYFNPMFRGYGNYNKDIFTQYNDATRVSNPYQVTAQGSSQVDWNNPQFRGLSDDLNELGDYYVKNSAPSESFLGAAVGGAAFGLINNLRLIAHPINAIKSLSPTAKMFADIGKDSSKLRNLWLNPETNKVVAEAYGQMHKLNASKFSRWPLPLFKAKIEESTVSGVVEKMKKALLSGDAQKIAEVSEEARRLTNAKTGYIPRGLKAIHADAPFRWAKEALKDTSIGKFLGIGKAKQSVADAAAKSVTDKAAASTIGGALKHSCGVMNGLMFAAFEFVSDLMEGKIQAAFDKDKETGYKQLGQTAIKGAGSAIGWAVGEGLGSFAGAWAAMKIGAIAGSTVAPGVGTAIGAVAGLIGGSIGCWLMGKVTHKIVGKDVGTLAQVDKMKQTKEGQVELLKLTAERAQEDKNLSQRTFQAIQNVGNFYGANA